MKNSLGAMQDLLIWKGGGLATLYRQEALDSDLASRVDASASHTPVFTCP
ncbi:MAG TPA: hypothetical protein VK302_15145 [Terriglobales bacterium]|nr:hypothetical protein [Terriglobales bacterium]